MQIIVKYFYNGETFQNKWIAKTGNWGASEVFASTFIVHSDQGIVAAYGKKTHLDAKEKKQRRSKNAKGWKLFSFPAVI